jgi:hypothetical protein
MRKSIILFQLVLSLFIISLSVNSAAQPTLKPSQNPQGLWGLADASGTILVPFKYSYANMMGENYVQIGLPSKTSQRSPNHYGVVNLKGQTLLPIQFDGIDYLRDKKRFKVVVTNPKGIDKFGVYDTQGKVVVPVIYEYLERISNMGDEPTNIMKLNGKTGYINIITGEVLIKPIYDALEILSLNTDAMGVGLGTAYFKGKWGIVSTNGQVVVPFEYDDISHLDTNSGNATATKKNQLLQLNFKDNQFTGTSELSTVYSSNFVPRFNTTKEQAKLYDGMYAAVEYPNMKTAYDGWNAGKLRWIAIPSLQIKGDEAYVSFGIFIDTNLPALPNTMSIVRTKTGFYLLEDVDDHIDGKEKPKKWLSFTLSKDLLTCVECAQFGLPTDWKVIKPVAIKPFAGIGVAINKLYASSELVTLVDVLVDGPAHKAGLRTKDSIVAINGQSIAQSTIDQVRDTLRGPEGSTVKVKYIRDGKAFETTITRATIHATSANTFNKP